VKYERLIRRSLLAGLVVGVAAVALGSWVGVAKASPPGCDTGPTVTYDGTDDAAEQVHALREEVAANCAAVTERLDQLHVDLASPVHVDCDNCAGASATSGTDGDPTYVRLASSDSTVPDLENAYVGLGGLLCGLFFGYLLYRQIMPRP